MPKTIEYANKLISPTVERSFKTGAIFSHDHLKIVDPNRSKRNSREESIYSSFDDESIEREKFDDIVSIATLDKSVQQVKQ